MIRIVEIKARCLNQDQIRAKLKELGSDCRGIDHQIDTYFNVPSGRLKLRQGNIENALIFYRRPDQSGPKQSDVILHHTSETGTLLTLLEASFGVLARVDKKREIHFIDHVKFHLDIVQGLGTFMEIEAIDRDGIFDADQLLAHCTHYMKLFDIKTEDLMEDSYSDQIIRSSMD